MYRIGNDKRKTQSAKLVSKGLEELMRTEDYANITVTQIVKASGVGRATFYRLFDDKSDVVLYRMELVFTELLQRLGPDTDSDVAVQSLFDIWLSQKELFLSLIQANLYGEFQTRLSFVIEKKLGFIRENIGLDSRSWQYFIHIRAAMLFTALRVAITQYEEDDSQDISNTLNNLFGKQPVIF
jgi:AcrR family transcriptional regulator